MINEYCPDGKLRMYCGYYKEAKNHFLNPERDKRTYKKLKARLRRRSEKRIIEEQLREFDDYANWQEVENFKK